MSLIGRLAFGCIALAAVVVVAATWPTDVRAGKTPAPFVPAPQNKPAGAPPLLEGESWTDATPDYVIRVQLITPAERLAYLKHVTGLNTDPFAAPPGETKHFTTFAVQVENSGTEQLSFNPDATWLTSERQKDLLTPYGLDELGFDYRTAGARFPAAYKHAEKALLQYPQFIDPGDQIAGLLVFRSVPDRAKRMQLELSITLASGDTVDFKAPYRRLTKKEREKTASEDTE